MKAKLITGNLKEKCQQLDDLFKEGPIKIKKTFRSKNTITIIYDYIKKTKYLLFLFVFFNACTIEIKEEKTINVSTQTTIKKWEDGIIYYNFDNSINENEKTIIKKCMFFWEEKTNIKFIQSENYNLNICKSEKENVYKSSIGRKENAYMELGLIKSYTKKNITHELGHVIGLTHEHQRPDRDDYIIINYDNIIEKYKFNFNIINNSLFKEELLKYDYNSIMHYDYYTCSNGNGPTIEVKNKNELGYSSKPSELDIQKVNLIYGEQK